MLLLLSSVLTGVMAQEAVIPQASEASQVQEQKQAGAWKVGLGIGYRHFDSTNMKLNSRDTHTLYENRDLGAMYESAYMQTSVSAKDEDVDFSDCLTPVVTGEYEFWRKDALGLSVVANLQYFNLDSSAEVNGESVVSKYYTSVLHPEFGTVLGGSEKHNQRSHASIDMELLVADCGLRANYSVCDSLALFMSGGPSLDYSDFSVKYDGHNHATEKVTGGLYAEGGLQYLVRKNISLEVVLRYDWVYSKATTSIAEQNLDGFGTAIKTVFSF